MTRKRKLSETSEEIWGREEMGQHPGSGGLFEETLLGPPLANHSYELQGSRETPGNHHHHSLGEAGVMSYMSESNSEIVDDPTEDLTNEPRPSRGAAPKSRKKIPNSVRLQNITITCEWYMCTTVFSKMERFIAHITDHLTAITGPVSSDGYLCSWRECDFACSTKDEIDRHVYFHAFHSKIKGIGLMLMKERDEKCFLDSSGRNVIPEIPEFFQCMWEDCTVRFASAHDFYCHTLGHVRNADGSLKKKKSFLCSWNGCTSSFSLRVRLSDHVRSHTQEKIVGCPNCGGIFASNTKFIDHCIRQMPLEAQQYQCSHCSRRYATERLLRDHVRHHINHYKCPDCDMTVPNKSALAAHMCYRHKKERPHKCMQCGRGFAVLSDVTRHLLIHSSEPAYSCPFQNCTYKSRSVSSQNRHIKLVHNGLEKCHYACHVCTGKFSHAKSLTRHLTKIHNFEWPVGHTRFRYKQDEDGFYRLQTVRYESIELNQEMMNEGEEYEDVDSPLASTVLSSPTSHSSYLTGNETPQQGNINHDEASHHDEQELEDSMKSKCKVKYQEIIMPSQY